MLINQIQQTKFSESEAVIMRYVLSQREAIASMTCQDIADATFTSAPLTIRIAKKLGFSGWNDFKKAFVEELNYLEAHQEVDASIPFVITDDPMSIAGNIIRLHEETIKDTRELLHHDEVSQAVSLLRKAKVIDIYTTSDYYPQAMTFKNRMSLGDAIVNIGCDDGTMSQMIAKSDATHLSIIISYSGETKALLRVLKWLRHKNVSIMAMTSIS
ncbi:MAG: MurR/RpiR family transcriptional regulator, partial [Erysipelotrichaceae bacterium]|nr:MurR/RpiR family transcriptional regulator [Erysipelotrichaceae bacterium]